VKTTDPDSIFANNQPKGAARNPSGTLDKDTTDVSPAYPPTNTDGAAMKISDAKPTLRPISAKLLIILGNI
jgi:hypothetical protein